jgi:YaiO family outer membrane protein
VRGAPAPALLGAAAALVLCGAAPLAAQTAAPAAAPQAFAPAATTSLGVDYGYVSFRGALDPWRLASVSLGRRGERGTVTGRVTHANRFRSAGSQVEVDAYPTLSRRTYGYLNAGYSRASIFPESRFGAELFAALPGAWEGSFGVRQLRFGGPPVTLLTGAVGKYVGNSWVSVRPTVRRLAGGYSAAASVTARKYFADADNYVGARGSYGRTPSDRLTPSELVARQSSWSAGVQGSRTLRRGVATTAAFGAEGEELGAGRARRRWDASAGLRFDLRGRSR